MLDENSMIHDGAERFNKQQDQMKAAGILGSVETKLASATINDVVSCLEEDLELTTPINKKPFWFYPLKTLDAQKIAFIGLNQAFVAVGQDLDVTNVCINIGKQISVELWALDFEAKDPKLFKRIFRMAKANHNSQRHRLKAMSAVGGREGFPREIWEPEQNINVGQAVLNAVIRGSGLFEVYDKPKKKFFSKALGLTEVGQRLVSDLGAKAQFMYPIFRPMLTKPAEWTSFNTGAYQNERLAALVPLVRKASRKQEELIRQRIESGGLDRVFKALNLIQSTPFKINKRVLDVVVQSYEQEHRISKFPKATKLPVAKKTDDWEDLSFEERKHIKKTREAIILQNRAVDADVVNFRCDVEIAKQLAEEEKFYLPHNLDFRGRVYPVPSFNHQRADFVRSLFLFANGKKLGSDGSYWLAVHLANCGDFDKISKKSFDDRVAWVNENQRAIYAIANKPMLTRKWWHAADKPFCFLAACIEFARFMEEGDDYVCHLPPAMDGANSGVQHYCAALRDRSAGRLVNLTDEAQPQDVYQEVANIVKTSVLDDFEDPIAETWLEFGITRKVVKRNVMTFAYSSEQFGFRKQLLEDLMEPLRKDVLEGLIEEHPFGDDNGARAASYLSREVWKAVTGVVEKAAEGMKFIQNCAAVLAHERRPLIWTSPIGLPVVHHYETWDINRVRIFLYDKDIMPSQASKNSKINNDGDVYNCIMLNLRSKPTGKIDKTKQRNAAAPNFIHSLDASHLMYSVLAAHEDYGINDFMLIHDSFATHCDDTAPFGHVIRDQFVGMYEQYDVFQDLYDDCYKSVTEESAKRLTSPPLKGDLDIREVITSKYAFS